MFMPELHMICTNEPFVGLLYLSDTEPTYSWVQVLAKERTCLVWAGDEGLACAVKRLDEVRKTDSYAFIQTFMPDEV